MIDRSQSTATKKRDPPEWLKKAAERANVSGLMAAWTNKKSSLDPPSPRRDSSNETPHEKPNSYIYQQNGYSQMKTPSNPIYPQNGYYTFDSIPPTQHNAYNSIPPGHPQIPYPRNQFQAPYRKYGREQDLNQLNYAHPNPTLQHLPQHSSNRAQLQRQDVNDRVSLENYPSLRQPGIYEGNLQQPFYRTQTSSAERPVRPRYDQYVQPDNQYQYRHFLDGQRPDATSTPQSYTMSSSDRNHSMSSSSYQLSEQTSHAMNYSSRYEPPQPSFTYQYGQPLPHIDDTQLGRSSPSQVNPIQHAERSHGHRVRFQLDTHEISPVESSVPTLTGIIEIPLAQQDGHPPMVHPHHQNAKVVLPHLAYSQPYLPVGHNPQSHQLDVVEHQQAWPSPEAYLGNVVTQHPASSSIENRIPPTLQKVHQEILASRRKKDSKLKVHPNLGRKVVQNLEMVAERSLDELDLLRPELLDQEEVVSLRSHRTLNGSHRKYGGLNTDHNQKIPIATQSYSDKPRTHVSPDNLGVYDHSQDSPDDHTSSYSPSETDNSSDYETSDDCSSSKSRNLTHRFGKSERSIQLHSRPSIQQNLEKRKKRKRSSSGSTRYNECSSEKTDNNTDYRTSRRRKKARIDPELLSESESELSTVDEFSGDDQSVRYISDDLNDGRVAPEQRPYTPKLPKITKPLSFFADNVIIPPNVYTDRISYRCKPAKNVKSPKVHQAATKKPSGDLFNNNKKKVRFSNLSQDSIPGEEIEGFSDEQEEDDLEIDRQDQLMENEQTEKSQTAQSMIRTNSRKAEKRWLKKWQDGERLSTVDEEEDVDEDDEVEVDGNLISVDDKDGDHPNLIVVQVMVQQEQEEDQFWGKGGELGFKVWRDGY
ncbi:uncharacterized protein IL334_007017 [Kwoniella shivajii]|uniref:Uncharacterized protein n=1 Tax=Kwoniella shivajii TaxID=564305 RepID=A0ABZ1D9R6_9TREE|nr:hypothetical protein IL334_007017 [Kwoniella shivajii]